MTLEKKIMPMRDSQIWRYMSIAKYIDLLRTRSLYFPQASRFADRTEGKWFGHANLYQNAERWRHSPANVKTLELILERAGEDQDTLLREIDNFTDQQNSWVQNILQTARRAYAHKRREYIEGVISDWKRLYGNHNPSVNQWRSDVEIYRESTYISCWNRASSMSLAMWEMYGKGTESVAVQSKVSKLERLIETNIEFLKSKGLLGGIVEVEYIAGLKSPDEDVQEQIYQILFERARDLELGVFSIKPDMYKFEEEVRAIIYPPRNLRESLTDPHPYMSGVALLSEDTNVQGGNRLSDFIERIYVHPTQGEDSLIVQTIRELNERFDVADIPIVADKIEALGGDIVLPPAD
jgi:hypothetical protein